MKLKLTLAFVVLIPTFVMAQGYVVIVNAADAASSLPKEEIANEFLHKSPFGGNNINENHGTRSEANPMPAQQAQEGKREGVSNRWFPDEINRVEGVLPGRFPNGVN